MPKLPTLMPPWASALPLKRVLKPRRMGVGNTHTSKNDAQETGKIIFFFFFFGVQTAINYLDSFLWDCAGWTPPAGGGHAHIAQRSKIEREMITDM